MRPGEALGGHFWTVWPHIRDTLSPPAAPAWSVAWSGTSEDDRFGAAPLSGTLCDLPNADVLVVIVHGLGGSCDSPYAVRTSEVAAQMGLASLRLNLRGADRGGADIYHAGLVADIRAAVESEMARKFSTVVVLGFSLGGHVALRLALEGAGRARAVAAVCAPLDLGASCAHIDAPGVSWIYRQSLLRGLREMYAATLRADLPRVDIDAVRTVREWDDRVVAPRFGFSGAEDYWAQCSVGSRLDELTVPCLYLGSSRDPMVPRHVVSPALHRAFSDLEVRWIEDGGHVGFPARVGIEVEVLRWLITSSATR